MIGIVLTAVSVFALFMVFQALNAVATTSPETVVTARAAFGSVLLAAATAFLAGGALFAGAVGSREPAPEGRHRPEEAARTDEETPVEQTTRRTGRETRVPPNPR